jgi:ATP-dependent protease ClpP protease subunit
MTSQRKAFFEQLEKARSSKVISFITGDRPGMETQISSEAYDRFVSHLDKIGVVEKISLYLYTRGGDTLAAWSLINLIRLFCKEFEVIIPFKALSSGTLISLGANNIVMTKQATLGPIDPSVHTPLNPHIQGGAPDARVHVSVEEVNGFLELAKTELGIHSENNLATILNHLSDKIHPLVLGKVYRTKSQIQMLARRLLSANGMDEEKMKKIISFLCSESGSHDYTIHRREARDNLGLKVETPSVELYALVMQIYTDIAAEMRLSTKFDVGNELGGQPQANYSCRRVLIESALGGTDVFLSEGVLSQRQIQIQPNLAQTAYEDKRSYEGWRHEN